MTKHAAVPAPLKTVRIAGVSFILTLLIPTLSAIFIFSRLAVRGDVPATAGNIMANELLFRIGIAGDLIMSINILVLSLALYILLKSASKDLAMFALCLRLGDAILWAVAALGSLLALPLLDAKAYSAAFGTEQLQALAALFLDVRYTVSSIAFAFLGLGMTVFCYLFLKSKLIPGKLAVFGMFSYALLLLFSFVGILLPDYSAMIPIQVIFYAPSVVFEPTIGIWLLAKGLSPRIGS